MTGACSYADANENVAAHGALKATRYLHTSAVTCIKGISESLCRTYVAAFLQEGIGANFLQRVLYFLWCILLDVFAK